jgi:hypothetical protein
MKIMNAFFEGIRKTECVNVTILDIEFLISQAKSYLVQITEDCFFTCRQLRSEDFCRGF